MTLSSASASPRVPGVLGLFAAETHVTTSLDATGAKTTLTQTLRYVTQRERDEDYPGVVESAKEVFANLDRYLTNRDR